MIEGTIANTLSIVAGGCVGLLIAAVGRKNSGANVRMDDDAISPNVMKALGLAVLVMGVHMTLKEHDYFPVVVCLALGTFIGELCRIEARIEQLGSWLKKISKSQSGTFVDGFVFASVLFCVGAMAILGSLENSLSDDPSLLYTKSLLDGIAAALLTGTLGIGVIFSAIPVLLYQGGISIGASQLSFLLENPIYINGISITGGVMIIAIGMNLAGLAKFRIANMLPAVVLIPIYDIFMI
ncbi:MAG: DUF554 domain-containing protein [Deferribacteraceae bacterium]|jgi:uncharacterized membrane protein YqgA involved in biofilm formation|nr:DUF554 domain-containing protein [Deferribacteraceae bacterium]